MASARHGKNRSTTVSPDDGEEKAFLGAIPWCLDILPQPLDILSRTLGLEASRLEELAVQPTFSLIAVLRDLHPAHLRELILSCRCQSYKRWQLVLIDDGSRSRAHLEIARLRACKDPRILLHELESPVGPSRAKNLAVELATGDYLAVIDGDGLLHPMALGILARQINDDTTTNLVFSNEAEIDWSSSKPRGYLEKPPFDLFTLLRVPYLGRLQAVRRDLLTAATQGGPVFRPEYDGIDEHDLMIRLALSGSVVPYHVPLFTYYRRAGASCSSGLTPGELTHKRSRLLEEHIPRAYPGAAWSAKVNSDPETLAFSSLWITDLPGRELPKLLIIIPFRDQIDNTIECLESIERQDHRLDVRVALVNNRSIEHETLPRLRDWIAKRRAATYTILDHDGAFNFARLNNIAAEKFGRECDLLLFLNNDVLLRSPQCIQIMSMELLANPTAGFVGIKLYYADGNEIQHGGVRFAEEIYGSGYYLICHAQFPSEFVDAERISLGVTFACAMTRRATYEHLGGLEEVLFPNSFGDVDICLRALEAGYRNYYLGSLHGIHHESISRGLVAEDLEYCALHEKHGKTIAMWRSRHLQHTKASSVHPRRAGFASTQRLPTRYRIADMTVGSLKTILGRNYKILRTSMVKAGKIARCLKSPHALYGALRMIIKPLPLLGPATACAMRGVRLLARGCGVARLVIKQLVADPSGARRLLSAYRNGGYESFLGELALQIPTLQLDSHLAAVRFKRSRPSPRLLAELRLQPLMEDAPRFTIVMPVYNIREVWLRQAIESVLGQTYSRWELICVNDGSPSPHIRALLDEMATRDRRISVIHCPRNRGVSSATNLGIEAATGNYIGFMDHDDVLEPHALHRFAEVVTQDRPDMIYSDEAITGENLESILRVDTRPAFSYDHYLGHPYFVHLIATRAELVREVGGLDESMSISQDVDLNLRLIEVCQTVCHVPEVLYRWRTHPASLGHHKMDQCRSMTRQALERHFARIGQAVVFEDETHFNYRDIRFQHNWRARVGILVVGPTNSVEFLSNLASLNRTVDPSLADIILIGHRSNAPSWEADGVEVRQRCRVVTYSGPWNLSAIINTGVAAIRGPYTHYLIISPVVQALDAGWLEHMLGYGQRADVGVVGALLLGQNGVVHEAGLNIEPDGRAAPAFQGAPFRHWIAGRNPGQNGCLLASREVSAVSAACMLTRAEVFDRLSGFDERLAVVLNDADYCLRASTSGYKSIHDAYAVLLHRGSAQRSEGVHGHHSEDVRHFRDRHRTFIEKGDPFHHPIFDRQKSASHVNALAGKVSTLRPRTTRVVLPPPATYTKTIKPQVHGAEQTSRGPHPKVRTDADRSMDSFMNRQFK